MEGGREINQQKFAPRPSCSLISLMFRNDACLNCNAPVNSYGHVWTLPPFYGTSTKNYDVMTSKKCFKYNNPSMPLSKAIRFICKDGLTKTTFPGQTQT